MRDLDLVHHFAVGEGAHARSHAREAEVVPRTGATKDVHVHVVHVDVVILIYVADVKVETEEAGDGEVVSQEGMIQIHADVWAAST